MNNSNVNAKVDLIMTEQDKKYFLRSKSHDSSKFFCDLMEIIEPFCLYLYSMRYVDDYSIESEEMIKQKIKPRLYDLLYVFGAVNPGTRDFEEYFDRLFLYVKEYHNIMMQYVFGNK